MSITERFRDLMTIYDEAVQEVQRKRKPLDGVFGLGHHPGSDPCHDTMDSAVEELCREAAQTEDAAALAALTEAIFRAERAWDGPEYARLMLAAIQRHTLVLIPLLEPGERARLAEWYRKEYPRRKRLPVQDRVMAALAG